MTSSAPRVLFVVLSLLAILGTSCAAIDDSPIRLHPSWVVSIAAQDGIPLSSVSATRIERQIEDTFGLDVSVGVVASEDGEFFVELPSAWDHLGGVLAERAPDMIPANPLDWLGWAGAGVGLAGLLGGEMLRRKKVRNAIAGGQGD